MVSFVKEIYVVFKTHFDIGFTGLAEEVIMQYGRRMLPDAVKTLMKVNDTSGLCRHGL